MNEIISGKTTESQIAAFLTALRMKGVTINETTAFSKIMKKYCRRIHPHVSGRLVDTCGTGGDKIKTFNISTTAAFVISGAGIAVAKATSAATAALTEKPDLLEPGFKVITPEKPVPPGFVDIYGVDKHGRRVIVELKRRPADKSAALQLSRYIESLGGGDSIRGIIAAPGLAKGVQKLIDVMDIEFRRVNPKECAEFLAKRKQESRPLSDYI